MASPRLESGVASPLSVYATTTKNPGHRIGERGVLDDRVFHFARLTNATGVVSNNLCAGAGPTANHVTETGALTGFTAGSSRFTAVLGATAAHVNMYQDGYFKVQSSTLGPGQIYKLRSHEAVDSSGTATFETYDPIVTTPTGTVTWSLLQNPWADIVITPVTTIVQMSVGVPLVAIPGATTAAPVYAWVQTWGPCSVLLDTSALVAGHEVATGVVVGSATVAAVTDIVQRIGVAMEAMTTDTIYASVFLQIAP